MAKERRTINVSLQSKKYLEPVNQILNEWEEDSLNLSTQICETLLQMQKLKASGTFSSVLAVYELIERVTKVYNIQDHAQIERLFAEAVTINHSKLGKLITNLNPELTQETIAKPATPKQTVKKEKPKVITEEIVEESIPVVEEVQSVEVEETVVTESQDGEMEIPLDFLLNG